MSARQRRRRRTPRRLRTLHASGKWSIRPLIFALYLGFLARALRLDLITTTESAGMGPAVRRALGRKWWLEIEGEFIVAGRRKRMKAGPGSLRKLTDQFGGSEDWRNTRAHYRWVRVVGAGPMLVIASHLSSAVQDGDEWSGFDKGVASHIAATGRIGTQVRRRLRVAEAVGAGRAMIHFAADVNLDLHLRRWRDYLRNGLGMRSIWDDSRPAEGTHHHRLIDAIWTTLRIVRARIVGRKRRPKALDHASVFAVLELPDRPEYEAEPSRRAA